MGFSIDRVDTSYDPFQIRLGEGPDGNGCVDRGNILYQQGSVAGEFSQLLLSLVFEVLKM
jgi:hypothetical protein